MKLFFDNNMIKQNSIHGMSIYYSSYIHNVIRVEKTVAKVIDFMLSKGSGNDFDINNIVLNCSLSQEEIREILSGLIDTDLFYDEMMKYRSSRFAILQQNLKKFQINEAYIHTTYKCNLDCDYCYNKSKINSCVEISIEKWRDVLEALKNTGARKIVLTGGEPILYPCFNDIVNYASTLGLIVEVLTNGTILHKLELEIIKKINLFIVSLDSLEPEKTHRKNTEKYSVLENILNLKKYGGIVKVRSVLTNKNINEVKRLSDFLHDKGIVHIKTLFIPNSKEEIGLIPDFDKLDYSDEEYDLCDINNCGAGYSIISISPDGIIYPCQTLMLDEFSITNVYEEDWYKKLEDSAITQYLLSRSVTDIDGCRECGYRTHCNGGCRAISYNLYGDMENKLDCFCDYYKRDFDNALSHIIFEE